MKKPVFLFLLAAVLVLSACARPSITWEDTTPKPPTIQTSRTPLDLLTEAVTNTQNAEACTVQYGTITKTGEDTSKELYIQNISADQPLDRDILYQQVPDFPTNEHLLSDFCSQGLQVVPSNTGTLRYELTDLAAPELDALMYGQTTEATDAPDAVGTAAITVDENNRISRLEFVLEYSAEHTVTIVLIVSFPSK